MRQVFINTNNLKLIEMEKELLKYGEKIPCTIEVLTPLHIGSGVKLLQGFDFFRDRVNIVRISQKDLEDYLKENPDDLSKFGDPSFKPESLLRKIETCKKYYINEFAREIYEFERNGSGLPYVPGSSMKGALRTAILSNRIKNSSDEDRKRLFSLIDRNEKQAGEKILENLFGDRPNHNLFKTISIFDSHFSEEDIDLFVIYILSLSNRDGSSFLWKKMGRDSHNQDNPSNATPLIVEMLKPGSKANFRFKVDSFYFDNEDANRRLKINGIKSAEMIGIINNYSLMQLESELTFFKKFKNKDYFKNIIEDFEKLKEELKNIKEGQAIMRMSWGVSWKFMTGGFITQEQIIELKRKFGFRMGKDGFEFPKTRKIIFDEGNPLYTPGWVKIRLFDEVKKDEKKQNIKNTSSEKNAMIDESIDPMAALSEKFKVSKK